MALRTISGKTCGTLWKWKLTLSLWSHKGHTTALSGRSSPPSETTSLRKKTKNKKRKESVSLVGRWEDANCETWGTHFLSLGAQEDRIVRRHNKTNPLPWGFIASIFTWTCSHWTSSILVVFFVFFLSMHTFYKEAFFHVGSSGSPKERYG